MKDKIRKKEIVIARQVAMYFSKDFTNHSLKSIGTVYSWHASKNLATILLNSKGKKYAVKNLEEEFKWIRLYT